MDAITLLIDAASRPTDAARATLRALDPDVANLPVPGRNGTQANSIAWLVWHAARQQDAQVSALAGTEQVWVSGAWAARLGVHRGPDEIGFGDSPERVAALRVEEPAVLLAYVIAVTDATLAYLRTLEASDLDDIVDASWEPPVTRGARLISTIDDAVAHLGQAEYARGLLTHWSVGY